MANPIPSTLALTTIGPSAPILSVDHRNNYLAVQTAVNELIAMFAGGTTGQMFEVTSGAAAQLIAAPGWLNVKHPTFGAVGDGSTDDTTAVQAAFAAAVTAGGGTVLFPPGTYKITAPITVQPANTLTVPLAAKGFGATIDLFSGSAGFVFKPTAAKNFRNFRMEGIKVKVTSLTTTDAFLVTDGGAASGFIFKFVFRDVAVESSLATTCNGFHATGTSTGVFEFELDNFTVDMQLNTTAYPILVDGTAGGTSSILLLNCNTRGGLVGASLGTDTTPIIANIVGGTYLVAQQHGLKVKSGGGTLIGAHVENNWLSAANIAAGGAGVFWKGSGTIIGLDDIRGTGSALQRWALDVYAAGGPLVIVGRGQKFASQPYMRVQATTETTGVIHTTLPADQIDQTAIVTEASPTMAVTVPHARVSLTYGASIATDASLGDLFRITATNNTAFTVANPTNAVLGQTISYEILNSSGGALGAITWGGQFKLDTSYAQPANGKRRTISFKRSGAMPTGDVWVQDGTASGDM